MLISAREFAFITLTKRMGLLPTAEYELGALAVLCPACPQPGINMDPDWMNRPFDERCVTCLTDDNI